jgi:glycosyltransferase involved in cell wall biosynthesis
MNIWLITIGEPLPLGISKDDRLHRTGQFARFLASRGHNVVWWTSTFDHFRKQHHFSDDSTVDVAPRLHLRALRGCGYSRNISLSRFRDHVLIARKFSAAAANCETPDILVAALPTIELCAACVDYGEPRGIPVVLDMRDMWPDIFLDVLPRPLRFLGRAPLAPLYRQARRACARAAAIIGVTEGFVEWGLRRGGRQRSSLDRVFPLAYQSTTPPADKLALAETFWDGLGVYKNEPVFTVCYFGNVGAQLDLTHVVEAARTLNQRGRPVRFVLCGRGERLEEYRRRAQGLPNILFPGWVDGAQIWSLMRRSNAGLDPLPDRFDFLTHINNKAAEYLSAGLPVISSPRRGTLCDLLASESCGLSYSAGSADELVGIVEHLRKDAVALGRMSARAGELFDQRFSSDVVYTQMAEYLAEVTACTVASAVAVR